MTAEPLGIVDRRTFAASVAALRSETGAAFAPGKHAGDAGEAVGRGVFAQLEWIEACLARGVHPDDAARITLAPLSQLVAALPPEYAAHLATVDYAFRRHHALALDPLGASVPPGAHRRGILQVRYGRHAFAKGHLARGQRLVVGRDERADFAVRGDDGIAARHVEVWWDGVVAHVRALTERRVTVKGRQTWRGELANGDTLILGDTTLRFFVEAFSPPRHRPQRIPARAVVASLFTARNDTRLHAVLDAARNPRIVRLLDESVDAAVPLYEGERARGVDAEAPYLVRFDPSSLLLERVLEEGWGDAWGIFIVSRSPVRLLRRALRRLLMVEADGREGRLYFRFYDPRVLARLAPLVTTRQRSEMLAEAEALYFETQGPRGVQLARLAPEEASP
ncbi:MAG: DUF4123 domain-containing protein [Myxococcota bacterium]